MSTFKDTQTASKNQIIDSCWTPFPEFDWVSGGISTVSDGVMAWGHAEDSEVAANRIRFLKNKGCNPDRAVAIDQVHGTKVVRVDDRDVGRGINSPDTRIPATDGIITDKDNLVLVTSHGDCAPLFLLDEEHRAIALVHAGWKGILAGICRTAIEAMNKEFKTTPADTHAAVGPMISTANYEVSENLASRFSDQFGGQVVNRVDGRPHLDLFSCITVDLLRSGMPPERIPARPPCTHDNPQYSSFRRDGQEMTGMISYFNIFKK